VKSGVRKGAAAVELAVLLPLLCFLFVITVDFARVIYFTVTITNCARNGAVYGSSTPIAANDTSGIQTQAQMDAGNLDLTQLNVSSSTDSSSVTVTVTYPFSTITNYPGVPSNLTISRTVQMRVSPMTPNLPGTVTPN